MFNAAFLSAEFYLNHWVFSGAILQQAYKFFSVTGKISAERFFFRNDQLDRGGKTGEAIPKGVKILPVPVWKGERLGKNPVKLFFCLDLTAIKELYLHKSTSILHIIFVRMVNKAA